MNRTRRTRPAPAKCRTTGPSSHTELVPPSYGLLLNHSTDRSLDSDHSVGCGYARPNGRHNAIGYTKHRSRSHDAVIRVYDEAGNVIETHEHKGDSFKP